MTTATTTSLAASAHDHFFLGTDHQRNERKVWLVIALTASMMLVEIIAGTVYGSMALVADGWHMSTHAGAMLITALAYRFARKHAGNPRFSFGTGKLGDLAGFASAIILALIALLIAWESLVRLTQPIPIDFNQAIAVAAVGLVINLVCAWLLKDDHAHHGHHHGHHHHHEHDHDHGHDDHHAPGKSRDNNLRAAYIHVLADALHDVTWIGSRFFTDTGGYYDSYRSSTAREAWPYDDTRDAGLAQVANGGGYPSCRQWWSDGSNGLRARLLGQVDPSLLNRLAGWAGFLSKAEVDDSVIRAIASPRQQKLNQGSVYTDYGGQIDKTLPNIVTRATGDVGMAVGAIAAFPAMDVVRQALPMVLALLKMALVICIPLVLVVGTYDLKTVVTVSVVQFALFFTDFWFQLARWIDSTILDALYGWGFGWNRPHTNFDPLVGLNNAFGDMLLMFVMGTMFLVLPGFWLASLTWVGIRAGHVIQGLSDGSKSAGQAGGKGAGALTGGKLK